MELLSPCIDVCKLDDDDVCIGCHRTWKEIINWMGYSEEERAEIMGRVEGQRGKHHVTPSV